MTDQSEVKFSIQNQTAIVTLNRPELHNAVNEKVMDQLESILSEIEQDKEIRSMILTGSGDKTFCAGGDLAYFAGLTTRMEGQQVSERMREILDRIWNSNKVSIAAVNGLALGGGCEILTACHFRVAAKHATLCYRQAKNGIITGWGGGVRLFQLVGRQRGLRLLLTSETVNVDQAYKMGLVDFIVDSDQLLPACLEFVEKIQLNSQETNSAFLQMARSFGNTELEQTKSLEKEAFLDLWISNDFRQFLKRFVKE